MLGRWKNIEELEESLNLDELEAIVSREREREYDRQKFAAALKGINLDEGGDAQEKVEEMKRRVEARRAGKSEDEADFDELGLNFETA